MPKSKKSSDHVNDWSDAVTHRPAATFPPKGTYTKKAKQIYLIMRQPEVSPNGLGSAIQMTQFFVNRAGTKMPEKQKNEILKAIELLRIELRYLKQADKYQLNDLPKPVYPAPLPNNRVGGNHTPPRVEINK